MPGLKKVEVDGTWWALKANGRWLAWDHLRADWEERSAGPSKDRLPPGFFDSHSIKERAEENRPSRAINDPFTSKLRILSVAAGVVAYMALLNDARTIFLTAGALCLVAGGLSFRSLRDDFWIALIATVGIIGVALWYGIKEGDQRFLVRIAILLAAYVAAFLARTLLPKPPPADAFPAAASTTEKSDDEDDPFARARPRGRVRFALPAILGSLFLVAAFGAFGWDFEALGPAVLVSLIAYYAGRRPSMWIVISSVALGLFGAFSIWFLMLFFSLGFDSPPATSMLPTSLLFAVAAYLFLSFAAAAIEDLPRLGRRLQRSWSELGGRRVHFRG